MFNKTNLTKIEKLLRQVVANQERLLKCWEDTAEPVAKLAKPDKIMQARLAESELRYSPKPSPAANKADWQSNIDTAIINYFTAQVSKTASAEALVTRMGWWKRGVNSLRSPEQVEAQIQQRKVLCINGLLKLMVSKQLVAKTGVRLGRITVLFGLPKNIPAKKRITLAKTKAMLRVTFPEVASFNG